METTLTVNVPLQQLQDVWINALDSGCLDYWAEGIFTHPGNRTAESDALDTQPDAENPGWVRYVAPFQAGGYVSIELQEPEDFPEVHPFDLAAMARALRVMSEDKRLARHLADILSGNDDANTADIFVQCAIFGEVIYG